MDSLELDNLRILLLNNESVELGLTIAKNLSDIEFNELVLGSDWNIVPHHILMYESYIKNKRLVLLSYEYDKLGYIDIITDSESEYNYSFSVRNILSENNYLRHWLTKTILRK